MKRHVLGVFAADRLPKQLTHFPCGFIANTDIHSKPGKHWIAFYVRDIGHVEFFDSYGKRPSYYNHHFSLWLRKHARNGLIINYRQIQGDYSNVCGLYCLHYLRQRLLGEDLSTIFRYFSGWDFNVNDNSIFDYMFSVYAHCLSDDYAYNQICRSVL